MKKLSQKAYVKSSGMMCPACCSKDVEQDDNRTMVDAEFVLVQAICNHCHSTWRDRYNLFGYESLQKKE